MAAAAERGGLRLAGRGLAALVIVLAAIPSYLTLAPAWRPLAARAACAVVVTAVGARLIRSLRAALPADTASAVEAPSPPPPPPDLDERFLRLRDELRFSVKSRQYFETILWPQLARFGSAPPRPPERRRWRRGGPSLAALERVVAAVEKGA